MSREFDGGMTQAMTPIDARHVYSKPTYSAGETIRSTGSHATEPIRPHQDPNQTIVNINVTRVGGNR